MNDTKFDLDECSLAELSGRAAGPTRSPILQIHPSLRCNLACAHCYSNSGPTARTELDVQTVCEVITDAAALGYAVVSVAGGEPLMYRGLEEVLNHAKTLGLRTTVTTNGYFTQPKLLERLRPLVDVLAISLDGPPDVHNQIRGSARAFAQLEAGLAQVRAAQIPFGIIHTVTQQNWEHLLWVAEFAAAQGAKLLQLHPLELAGRASDRMTEAAADEEALAKVYLLSFALRQKYAETMAVQLDVLHQEDLREEPGLVYAGELAANPKPAQLHGLLVLEADGTVVPLSYGFARRYQLCNVREQRLAAAWPSYLARAYPAFKQLCQEVYVDLCNANGPPLVNWHEVMVARSQAAFETQLQAAA
ncbi:MAG: radical SAM protein [Acidobacteria bacterium]|nr:radical SAM protein [Acidobacteriota bacterium]MBI3422344.1 radical SAM protein [Acidobacteriota bacterium]